MFIMMTCYKFHWIDYYEDDVMSMMLLILLSTLRIVRYRTYQRSHSTKTALLKVVAGFLGLAMLTMLDLTADFDSVDHDTLLQ